MSLFAKLPKTMPSAVGSVPVVVVKDLKAGKQSLMGQYKLAERTIYINEGMHATATRQTLWHEWIHCILLDSGVQLKTKQAEAVCDSLATALTAHF